MASGSPVAPELAEYIADYVVETDLNRALGRHLDADSNLIVFCREFFLQFFANVLDEPIDQIGPTSARRANVLLRRHRADWTRERKAILRRFQHFCKLYPDLLGNTYGGGLDAVGDFHFDYIPTLLTDIEIWARSEGHDKLRDAISTTRERFAAFEATLEPPGT